MTAFVVTKKAILGYEDWNPYLDLNSDIVKTRSTFLEYLLFYLLFIYYLFYLFTIIQKMLTCRRTLLHILYFGYLMRTLAAWHFHLQYMTMSTAFQCKLCWFSRKHHLWDNSFLNLMNLQPKYVEVDIEEGNTWTEMGKQWMYKTNDPIHCCTKKSRHRLEGKICTWEILKYRNLKCIILFLQLSICIVYCSRP